MTSIAASLSNDIILLIFISVMTITLFTIIVISKLILKFLESYADYEVD